MGYIGGLAGVRNAESWGGEKSFDPPAEGEYRLRVTEMEEDKSSKGNSMLVTKIEIVSAADGSETSEDGKVMTDWRSLLQKKGCQRRLKALLNAVGVEVDEDGGFDTDQAVGVEFLGRIKHDSVTKVVNGEPKTYDNNPKLVEERPAN